MTTERNQVKGVAIIGMAGRFPGANDIDAFWQNLCQGVQSINFFTDEEVLATGVDPRLLHHPDYVKAWGVMDHEDLFDANFFGIPGREAEAMDPQHRHFLEICVHTLENAGYNPETYEGLIGLICGVGISTYLLRNLTPNADRLQALGEYLTFIGNDKDFMGTRVAYKLNLRGGAHSVSTACSTTMVAVHLACRQLLSYESDMAIAGGANIKLPQKSGYLYRKGHLKSKDGRCHAFDERASGTVFGCGVAAVLLKRAQEAVEDGDHIYAIIRSSAINNDGNSKAGYTAPSVIGQTEVIAQAHELAGFDPETITHMEAHGTGTELGDPCEVKALSKVFRRNGGVKNQYCALTSVKTNIGHLDNVGGVAGLIKLALSMKNKKIPPSLNFERPNPEIDFANSPFFVNTVLRDWPESPDHPRRACISAFGAGGTNAHAVLEEAPALDASDLPPSHILLTLSAKTSTALAVMTSNLRDHLVANPDLNLADVAYTQNIGRMNHMHRRALVFSDRESLLAGLSNPDETAYCYTGILSADGEARKEEAASLVKTVPTLSESALFQKLEQLAQLWVNGAFIDWYDFYEGRFHHRLPLPNYPFESVRYWIDQPEGLAAASEEIVGSSTTAHRMAKLPMNEWFYEPSWQRSTLVGPHKFDDSKRCYVVFSDPCGVGDAIIKQLREMGREVVLVTPDTTFSKPDTYHYQIDPKNPNHYNGVLTEMQNLGRVPAAVFHCWSVTVHDAEDQADVLGFYSLIYLAQALVAQAYETELQVLAVSTGVHDVLPGDPLCPGKTTMMAPVRVVPQEHPNLRFRAVDIRLEEGANLQALSSQLIQEAFTQTDENILALRQGRRWTQSWSRLPIAERDTNPKLRQGGTYLVTGGLGGIGFVLAEYLATRYQAQLVLTGRAALPERAEWDAYMASNQDPGASRRIGRLRHLESVGGRVLYVQADASDRADMVRAIEAAEKQMGVIQGVIHAAGLAEVGMILRKTPEAAEHVLAPKTVGTRVLASVFENHNLDFFMMCSSLATATGGYGQVAYVAANTYQDAFAVKYAHRNFVAFNWDAWKETGMAVNRQTEDLQLKGISNLEGALAFDRALGSGLTRVAISTHDLIERMIQSRRFSIDSVKAIEDLEGSVVSYPRPEMSSPYREPQTDLEKIMVRDWMHILGMDRVGVDDDFFELGGDSLKGMNVVNALEKRLGEQFHIEALFDMSTIGQLSRYLEDEYADAVAKLLGNPVSAPAMPAKEKPITAQDVASFRALIPEMAPVSVGQRGVKNRQAIFILAPQRSGSTLLRVMMAGHSGLIAPPELHLLNFNTVAEREAAFTGSNAFWRDGLIHLLMMVKDCSEPHARSLVEELAARGTTIKDLYHHLQDLIAAERFSRRLVDKTPAYASNLDVLRRAELDFHEPLFIHLKRHPQGMIHSYCHAHLDVPLRHSLGGNVPFTTRQLAEMLWLTCQENIHTFLKEIPANRQYALRFEDLVQEPEREMRSLCGFLGLEFEADMLLPYKEKHRRMTETINHESPILGDHKFHTFQKIEASTADAWQQQPQSQLSPETLSLAEKLGYGAKGAAPKASVDTSALLANVDDLDDDALDAALAALENE